MDRRYRFLELLLLRGLLGLAAQADSDSRRRAWRSGPCNIFWLKAKFTVEGLLITTVDGHAVSKFFLCLFSAFCNRNHPSGLESRAMIGIGDGYLSRYGSSGQDSVSFLISTR